MSVLVDLSIFPLDKGASLSAYVARAVAIIRRSGLPHAFGPMSTTIEGEWDEVMAVVGECLRDLERDCDRVYAHLRVDARKGPPGRLTGKIASVEARLGPPS